MANSIRSVQMNVQDGLLTGTLHLNPGLNVISGENGTLKTKLLQFIKAGSGLTFATPHAACRLQAVSPKRNAQRRAFLQAYDELRRSNTKLEGLTNERNINDSTFEAYPSLGDLFYVVYEDLCKNGGSQIECMQAAAKQFNDTIQKVFSQYELAAEWNAIRGAPEIALLKSGAGRVPLEGLSLGEQEALSLVANVQFSRDRYEVFLIDEPEIHLNWNLEDKLFTFFDAFCADHGKQMIVVTHSRAIFKPSTYAKTQFLFWGPSGRVEVAKEATAEQIRRIAGEAIEIIKLGAFTRPVIFVEDARHEEIISMIARALSRDITTSRCGNKQNLRSLFRYSLTEGGWANAWFVEDGDNEGSPFDSHPQFIHLEKYCIENYLLRIDLAAEVSGRTSDEVRSALFASIAAVRGSMVRTKDKFFEFLFDQFREEHLTPGRIDTLDASVIFDRFVGALGLPVSLYLERYVALAMSRNQLRDVFPAELISALEVDHQPTERSVLSSDNSGRAV